MLSLLALALAPPVMQATPAPLAWLPAHRARRARMGSLQPAWPAPLAGLLLPLQVPPVTSAGQGATPWAWHAFSVLLGSTVDLMAAPRALPVQLRTLHMNQ